MGRVTLKTHILLLLLALALSAFFGCAVSRQEVKNSAERVSAKWEAQGIEVIRIKPTKNGMMLDLRYRVTDPELAREMIKQTTPLSLVDQASGDVLPVPNMAKVGKLRNVPNSDDTKKVYWVFFNNPGGLVKAGSKVTLNIGDVKIKDINVE